MRIIEAYNFLKFEYYSLSNYLRFFRIVVHNNFETYFLSHLVFINDFSLTHRKFNLNFEINKIFAGIRRPVGDSVPGDVREVVYQRRAGLPHHGLRDQVQNGTCSGIDILT